VLPAPNTAREVDVLVIDHVEQRPGTLYGCLKRMLAGQLVEESEDRPDPDLDDERRRYYRITALGARALRAEAERLASAVAAARAKRLFSRKPVTLAETRY
jgi:DNA-binding PadR family transcriptional regulator